MSKFMESLRHAVYEDTGHGVEPETEYAPPLGPTPTLQAVPAILQTTQTGVGGSDLSPASQEFYTRLFAASDYMQDKNIQQLFSLMKPLEGIIADPHVRMNAALAQMKNTYGIGTEAIMAGIDKAAKALGDEGVRFDITIKAANNALGGKKITADKMESDLALLRSEIKATQDKINSSRTAFESAAQRRQKEILDLKADFSNLK